MAKQTKQCTLHKRLHLCSRIIQIPHLGENLSKTTTLFVLPMYFKLGLQESAASYSAESPGLSGSTAHFDMGVHNCQEQKTRSSPGTPQSNLQDFLVIRLKTGTQIGLSFLTNFPLDGGS